MAPHEAIRWTISRPQALYLVGLSALAFCLQFVSRPGAYVGPDAPTYLQIARDQLSEVDFWADPSAFTGNFWSPGYPTILAMIFRPAGENLTAVVVLQALLMASLVWVPWVLTQGLPKANQWLAPAVLALAPGLWWMGHTIGYEAILAWSVTVCFTIAWLLSRGGLGQRKWILGAAAAFSGLLLAAATLIQTKSLVLVPVIGYLLLRAGRPSLLVAAGAFFAGLVPWVFRNTVVRGNPNPLAGNGGYNLWVGNNPDATTGGSMLIAPPTPGGLSMTDAAFQFIISQPERIVELVFSKAGRLLHPVFLYPDVLPVGPLRTVFHAYPTLIALFLAIGTFAFLGAWMLHASSTIPDVRAPAAAVLIWFVSHLPFIAEARFMTTVLPLTVVVASASWVAFFGRVGGSAAIRGAEAKHARVKELEREGMSVELDLNIPSWRTDEIVRDAQCIEETCTETIPAQGCGLAQEDHSWPNLYVRTLATVTLDVDSGLVFSGDRVIAQSGSGTRAARDASFVSGATFRARENRATPFSGAVAPLGDMHHHYHVMMETLPRLLHCARYRGDVTFVTSSPIHPRYMELLNQLDLSVETFADGTILAPSEVVLVDQPELFWPRRVDLNILRDCLGSEEHAGSQGLKFYVSRGQVSRTIKDERLLEAGLRERGYEPVVMDRLPIQQQIRLFERAEAVVALHGAALAGIPFMRPGSQVLEISSGEVFEECYRRIAHLSQLSYACMRVPGSPSEPQGDAESIIDAVDAHRALSR